MKNTGVWLDKKRAIIITIENDREIVKTVYSSLENYNITANRHIGGANEVVKDRKYLEREKQQLKSFYNDIIEHIEQCDAVVIFGPAETYRKFNKLIDENYKGISSKVKSVEKADSMTDNQVRAWVRDFFHSNS